MFNLIICTKHLYKFPLTEDRHNSMESRPTLISIEDLIETTTTVYPTVKSN